MKELPLAPTGALRHDEATHQLLCPSARPEWPRARVIGIVTGSVSQPRVKYLEQSVLVSDELMNMTAPVSSTEVFQSSSTVHAKRVSALSAGPVSFGGEDIDDLTLPPAKRCQNVQYDRIAAGFHRRDRQPASAARKLSRTRRRSILG